MTIHPADYQRWAQIVPPDNTPEHYGANLPQGRRHRDLAYERGFVGCFVDHEDAPEWARRIAKYERSRFLVSARVPHAIMKAPGLNNGTGKRALNFNHYRNRELALTGSQNYGNCTAWSGRAVVGLTLATLIATSKESHAWPGRPSTVGYAFRGHCGQGMAIERMGWAFTEIGIPIMRDYGEGYDFTDEDEDEYWGNKLCRGVPDELVEAFGEAKIRTASFVEPDAGFVRDLLFNGYYLHVGSTRTAGSSGDPIAKLTTPANHAEALIGYDDTDEFRDWYKEATGKTLKDWVGIWDQSWGNWNRLTNWPSKLWGPAPHSGEGLFVLSGDDTMKKVAQSAMSYSGVDGFPGRTMTDWGFGEWL